MEPANVLKRSASADDSCCLICQTDKPGYMLRKAGEQGIATIRKAALSRRKLRDANNYDVIDRIESVLDSSPQQTLWHKTCYATFTDTSKIERLKRSLEKLSKPKASTSTSASCETPARRTRASSEPVDWTKCMFCQTEQPKVRLTSVMTPKKSREILDAAEFDHTVGLRVAGVIDLMAVEAKYHLICLSSFMRQTRKTMKETVDNDVAMAWLLNELHYAAEKGQVLQLNDVWERYVELANDSSAIIPRSYHSRRATFKEKLESDLGDMFYFMQPLDKAVTERHTILISMKFGHTAMLDTAASDDVSKDEQLTMPHYRPSDDIHLSLIHVALKLRGDILEAKGHTGLSVSEDDAIECVPDSLYMFLRVIYGGQSVFEDDCDDDAEDQVRRKILSVAQDLIYGISGGRKLTPKHIGLASTIHQATRSKSLVQLLHKAGHCISYEQVLKMDTALAESTLQTLDTQTGAVIPPNIIANKFVHYTADNIDILDETLDGKNTFHATQVAAWQRGIEPDVMLHTLNPSSSHTLKVHPILEELIPVNVKPKKPDPVFATQVEQAWFDADVADSDSVKNAHATDLAFFVQRQTSDDKVGWTEFNETLSTEDPEQTAIGYIPIILAPAHEFDTLNTVVKRCMAITSSLGQEHTVITVDQALYCKLMELKWSVPEYQNSLIPRLGGLHISMNFLKTIGDHMRGSGLAEIWIESGLLGQGTAELVLSGKAYNKGMRLHKLTLQALWRLMMPRVLDFVAESDVEFYDQISDMCNESDPEANAELATLLKHDRFQKPLDEFVANESGENATVSFWWQYMDMVAILLLFTRAQRDGIWNLHLESFGMMLPYFMRYDHYNYARWGPVYLAEMHQLPAPVLSEFEKGNFVVKRSARKFNQVDPDQAQEWLNGVGKKGGGIVGITKTTSALCRWTLSYNLRSHIAVETYAMYQMRSCDKLLHNESTKSRKKRDNADEDALLSTFQRFGVFTPGTQRTTNTLQNIANKDLATEAIQESLLNVKCLGQGLLRVFVQERLVVTEPNTKPHMSLHDPLARNNALTFATLYDVKDTRSKDQKQVTKADRSVLQRLITAFEAGRPVNMPQILQHELMPVPLSIAELNGTLRTGNKSVLADLITEGIDCPETIELHDNSSCLIIDGQALVVAIGRPTTATNFGDLADVFVKSVLQTGSKYQRIDIVFDRYRNMSIKSGTRARRTKTAQPIRRIVEGRDVPLPKNWDNFMALPANKADLARFLSEEVLANAPDDKVIVVAGGFADELEVRASNETTDVTLLRAMHEEGDTRLILHAVHSQFDTVVVAARDTDVLLLLLAHFPRVQCMRLFMMTGTSKKRRYIPIQRVFGTLTPQVAATLLPFHALTGCDTTSYLSSHTKRTAWKVFKGNHELLIDLGVGEFTQAILKSAEKFLCRIYNVAQTDSIDTARYHLFAKSVKPEALPPTSDALRFHVMRVHYQSMIWRQADTAIPELPAPDTMGWERSDHGFVPILMTLSPIPAACLEMISCSCHMQCKTLRCKCRKTGLRCTALCRCKSQGDDLTPCMNMM